jgi:Ca2+-binding RTX toxin-like protein
MAIKIFNSTETNYFGTTDADLVVGNALDNTIDGGAGDDLIFGLGGYDTLNGGLGNDAIFGGSGDDFITTGDGITNIGNNLLDGGGGNDIILAGSGNDVISGGAGDDTIDTGDGNNIVDGGDGIDFITAGAGDDELNGGAGNDELYGGDGDDLLVGGDGDDRINGDGSSEGDETVEGNLFIIGSGTDFLFGADGNDTFRIGAELIGLSTIDAGVSELDNAGIDARYSELEADEATGILTAIDATTGERVDITTLAQAQLVETDVRLNLVTRPGSTALSTFASSIAGYNAVDTLEFTQSGDFSESLAFTGIERIEVASGKNIVLSAGQITDNTESLDLGAVNPGTHFYGVAGGPKESVTIVIDEYLDNTFTPAATVIGATESTYSFADFQLDDATVADLFHNIDAIYDATAGLAGSYTRIDGANNAETVYGSEGVDNATMRLGNDEYHGNGGNDLIVGHGGADKLYGDAGNDIFTVGGFGSGVQGTTSKADDGNAEWINGAGGDLVVGGAGTDTFRITTGIGANTAAKGTIMLNDANFKSMEVVQVGATAGRINTEDAALQLLNDHYYHRANSSVADLSNTLGNNGGSINNVVVNASGVTLNGLRFEGNANTQTFIGTTKADVFVGNGGNDVLTGGGGADKFVFGKVHEMVVTGAATAPQSYVDTAFALTGKDTITDFLHNTDKIQLNLDQYSQLAGFNASMLRSNATGTAADANDYLLFNTTSKMLSYDADGNGAGAAVDIATLTGVNTFTAIDVLVA